MDKKPMKELKKRTKMLEKLKKAIDKGEYLDTVKKLKSKKSSFPAFYNAMGELLVEAVLNNKNDIAEHILNNFSLSIDSSYKDEAAFQACANGNVKTLELLSERGTDLNRRIGGDKYRGAHLISYAKNDEVFDFLLSKKVEVDDFDLEIFKEKLGDRRLDGLNGDKHTPKCQIKKF